MAIIKAYDEEGEFVPIFVRDGKETEGCGTWRRCKNGKTISIELRIEDVPGNGTVTIRNLPFGGRERVDV